MYKLSLGKFINEAINEMFKGILMGELENERLLAEIKDSINLNNENFIKKYFKENYIRTEIIDIFPTEENQKSRVDYGQVYIEKSENKNEEPAIKDLIDYDMKKGIDYALVDNTYIITREGYNSIYNKVANNMVFLQKSYIRSFINKGVPRLAVSSGKINAKVIIERDNIDKTKVNGVHYQLYKYGYSCKEIQDAILISKGISKNLKIQDCLLNECDIVAFEGYIIIDSDNCYRFSFNCNKNIHFEINNKRYILDNMIFLKEGIYQIKIIVDDVKLISNSDIFDLNLYIKTKEYKWMIVEDRFFLREIYLEESFRIEKGGFNNFNENIKVKLISSNSSVRYNIASSIGEIEINYNVTNEG